MSGFIDLRSDTVTKPTAAMRAAMAAAEVGDDVFGEDPTVNALQEKAAELLGHEAALFCPTGSMANQLAVFLHTKRGDEVLLEAKAHLYHYEVGALAAIAGVQPRFVETADGVMSPAQVAEGLREAHDLWPRTALACFENSHNLHGGSVWPPDALHAARKAAQAKGVPAHLDGARLFNAAHASGVAAKQLAAGFDSVMVSLSKGLGCPVGSLLLGAREFIRAARPARKRLGGGMRQAGILAAAGIHALENHLDRLGGDHANAKALALALSELPGLRLDPAKVVTNILIAQLPEPAPDAGAFLARLKARGVLAVPFGPRTVRFVTHLDFDGRAIPRVRDACAAALRG